MPHNHWPEDWEKQAILSFYAEHSDEGYRRLTYMTMDADVVADSPASVYRALKAGGAPCSVGTAPKGAKEPGFDNRSCPTSIGTSISRTSTFAGHSTI